MHERYALEMIGTREHDLLRWDFCVCVCAIAIPNLTLNASGLNRATGLAGAFDRGGQPFLAVICATKVSGSGDIRPSERGFSLYWQSLIGRLKV